MAGCIVGWAHTPFGKHEGKDVEALMLQVIDAALADAGVDAADIDRLHAGGEHRTQPSRIPARDCQKRPRRGR